MHPSDAKTIDRLLGLVDAMLAGRPEAEAEIAAALEALEGGERLLGERLLRLAVEQATWRRNLAQTAKMAEVGLAMAQLVHELRQPLAGVAGFAQLLATDLQGNEAASWVHEILGQTARMQQFIERLRRFLRSSDEDEREVAVDLQVSIKDAVALFSKMPPGVKLEIEVEPGLPKARGEASQLTQVLTNLIANARDATAPRAPGRILMRASADATGVEVVVADQGAGLAAETRGHLFEPFFTTKGEKGTGLGLYISRDLLKQWGGELRILDQPPEGFRTAFQVWLPRAKLAPARPAAPDAPDAPAARPLVQSVAVLGPLLQEMSARLETLSLDRRVLVVDDEPGIRRALQILLASEEGLEVVEAADGPSALDLLARRPAQLMLVDLRLPGMDGLEVLRAARLRDPLLEALVVTGRPSPETALAALELGACDYLVKPFRDVVGLRARVRSALERNRARQLAAALRGETRHWAERLLPLLPELGANHLKAPLSLLARRIEGPAQVLVLGQPNGADFVTLSGHLALTAESADEAAGLLAKGEVDALLVGPEFEPGAALEVGKRAMGLPCPPRVLWAAPIPDFAFAQAVLRAGACKVLEQPLSARQLGPAILTAVHGRRTDLQARALVHVLKELGIREKPAPGTASLPVGRSA